MLLRSAPRSVPLSSFPQWISFLVWVRVPLMPTSSTVTNNTSFSCYWKQPNVRNLTVSFYEVLLLSVVSFLLNIIESMLIGFISIKKMSPQHKCCFIALTYSSGMKVGSRNPPVFPKYQWIPCEVWLLTMTINHCRFHIKTHFFN